MENNELEKKIMRRVYHIYVLRRLMSFRALCVYSFIGVCVGLASVISVGAVFSNIPFSAGLGSVGHYMLMALRDTEFLVHMLLGAGVILFVWILWDSMRSLRELWGTKRVAT